MSNWSSSTGREGSLSGRLGASGRCSGVTARGRVGKDCLRRGRGGSPSRPDGPGPGSARRASRFSKPVAMTVIFTSSLDVLVDDRAEDDVRLLVGGVLDQGERLVDLVQRHVAAAGDVDQDAGRAVDAGRPRAAGELIACCIARQRALVARGAAGAHQRAALVAHDRLHVGEVDVDEAVVLDEVADALHGVEQHLVGALEGLEQRHRLARRASSSRWLGMVISVSTAACSSSMPCSACLRRLLPSKRNGLVTTPTVSAPSARDLRDDRRRAGAGAAAHAGGDEHHVGARRARRRSRPCVSSAAWRPTSGLAPAPRPLVSVAADLDLASAPGWRPAPGCRCWRR